MDRTDTGRRGSNESQRQLVDHAAPLDYSVLHLNSDELNNPAKQEDGRLQDQPGKEKQVSPESIALPKDWVILPLPKDRPRRTSSIRVHLSKDGVRLQEPEPQNDDVSGTIDIDWDDPDEPVKFNVPKRKHKVDSTDPPPPYDQAIQVVDLKPFCFSIISDEIDPTLAAPGHETKSSNWQDWQRKHFPHDHHHPDKQQTGPLTEEQIREARRQTRHYIRIVTRNSLGLMTTTALSSVAPQLLIASAINAYCLAMGSYHLYQHHEFLTAHGITMRKRDISLAVAEGVVVKTAVLFLTVGHDDFLVFGNAWFGPALKPIEHAHDALFGPGRFLGEPARWFLRPAEIMQEKLGIATMGQRAAAGGMAMAAGWAEPARKLLENIFAVGAVQGGMELVAEGAEKRLGSAGSAVVDGLVDDVEKVRRWVWSPGKERQGDICASQAVILGSVVSGSGEMSLLDFDKERELDKVEKHAVVDEKDDNLSKSLVLSTEDAKGPGLRPSGFLRRGWSDSSLSVRHHHHSLHHRSSRESRPAASPSASRLEIPGGSEY